MTSSPNGELELFAPLRGIEMTLKQDLSGSEQTRLLNQLGHLIYGKTENGESRLEVVDAIIIYSDGSDAPCACEAENAGLAAINLVAKIKAVQEAGGYVINGRNANVRLNNDMWSRVDRIKGGG